jgi:hypothetical protein
MGHILDMKYGDVECKPFSSIKAASMIEPDISAIASSPKDFLT